MADALFQCFGELLAGLCSSCCSPTGIFCMLCLVSPDSGLDRSPIFWTSMLVYALGILLLISGANVMSNGTKSSSDDTLPQNLGLSMIGVAFFSMLAWTIFLVIRWYRRKKKKEKHDKAQQDNGTPMQPVKSGVGQTFVVPKQVQMLMQQAGEDLLLIVPTKTTSSSSLMV